jgi:hypothetical protein
MKQQNTYVVYINYPDYTIKTSVSNSTKKINVSESLTYFWYASNKIIQTKGDYDGKLIDGAYTSFYLSSNLKEKGNFKKGLKDGKWISWYDNGKINEIINWRKGIRSGEYKKFDSNEFLSITSSYKNGKLNGIHTTYANGEIDKKTRYKHGREIIKRQKNTIQTDSTAQSTTVQPKKTLKEKIRLAFKRKKKTAVKNEASPVKEKKAWKERLNSFFRKDSKKTGATTTVEATSTEMQDLAPSEVVPKKKKAKKINKP